MQNTGAELELLRLLGNPEFPVYILHQEICVKKSQEWRWFITITCAIQRQIYNI